MAEDKTSKKSISDKAQPIGKVSRELLLKGDQKQGVVDTQREVDKEYFTEINKCVHAKPHCDWIDPWYVVILHKRERLLENVVRRYFFGRQSLPTPEYDQTVWRYYPSSGNLEFIWCIPDKNTTLYMYDRPGEIVEEQKHLKKFVFDFINGTLYNSVIKKYPEYNKETFHEEKIIPIHTT